MSGARAFFFYPRGFAPRHASAKATALSAVSPGEGGTPRALSLARSRLFDLQALQLSRPRPVEAAAFTADGHSGTDGHRRAIDDCQFELKLITFDLKAFSGTKTKDIHQGDL